MADVNLKITADTKDFDKKIKSSKSLLDRFEKSSKRSLNNISKASSRVGSRMGGGPAVRSSTGLGGSGAGAGLGVAAGAGLGMPKIRLGGIARMGAMGLLAGLGFKGAGSIAQVIKDSIEYNKQLYKLGRESNLSNVQLMKLDNTIKVISLKLNMKKNDILEFTSVLKNIVPSITEEQIIKFNKSVKAGGYDIKNATDLIEELSLKMNTTDPNKLLNAFEAISKGDYTGWVDNIKDLPDSLFSSVDAIENLSKLFQIMPKNIKTIEEIQKWMRKKGVNVFERGYSPIIKDYKIFYKKLGKEFSFGSKEIDRRNKDISETTEKWATIANEYLSILGPLTDDFNKTFIKTGDIIERFLKDEGIKTFSKGLIYIADKLFDIAVFFAKFNFKFAKILLHDLPENVGKKTSQSINSISEFFKPPEYYTPASKTIDIIELAKKQQNQNPDQNPVNLTVNVQKGMKYQVLKGSKKITPNKVFSRRNIID